MGDVSKATLEQWLAQQRVGTPESEGRFSVALQAGERSGLPALRLYDVPLLTLAAAVEGGCERFRVRSGFAPRLEWDGRLGPSWEVAASLLRAHRVDAALGSGRLDLPPFFSERMEPLARRCRHAPLRLWWNGELLCSRRSVPAVQLTRSRRSRLVIVDRGLDFLFPAAFPGLDIVAWVPPLPGAPWPRRLAWGRDLEATIRRIVTTIQDSGASLL